MLLAVLVPRSEGTPLVHCSCLPPPPSQDALPQVGHKLEVTQGQGGKKKHRNQQECERMWRSWNSCALLVGMKDGSMTMENSMAIPKKITNNIII